MTFLMQVVGGDPLLKLVAIDWLKVDKPVDKVALHSRSMVQVKIDIWRLYIIIFIQLQMIGWVWDANIIDIFLFLTFLLKKNS